MLSTSVSVTEILAVTEEEFEWKDVTVEKWATFEEVFQTTGEERNIYTARCVNDNEEKNNFTVK